MHFFPFEFGALSEKSKKLRKNIRKNEILAAAGSRSRSDRRLVACSCSNLLLPYSFLLFSDRSNSASFRPNSVFNLFRCNNQKTDTHPASLQTSLAILHHSVIPASDSTDRSIDQSGCVLILFHSSFSRSRPTRPCLLFLPFYSSFFPPIPYAFNSPPLPFIRLLPLVRLLVLLTLGHTTHQRIHSSNT